MSTIDIIVLLLKQSGKTQKELTDFLGVSKNTFTDWKSGRIKSYSKYLPKIAEFFDVSVDYLTGRTEKAVPEGPPLSEEDKMFLSLLPRISQEKKKILLQVFLAMLEQEDE